MRNVTLALGLLALAAVPSVAAPFDVLIIDQTQTFMEAMQVEVLARALIASGLFTVRAALEVPPGPHPQGPFQFAMIIPPGAEFAWVCAPGLPEALPRELRGALAVLKGAVEQVFRGERRGRDPGDDLYPLIWSIYFLYVGVLGEGR